MADHIAVGRAAIDAVRDAANRWLFPGTGEPWSGVRWVAVAASPHSTHAVEVSEVFDRGVASLAAHRAYLEALGGVRPRRRSCGEWRRRTPGGCPAPRLATAFELIEL